jgi:hypothetical protein
MHEITFFFSHMCHELGCFVWKIHILTFLNKVCRNLAKFMIKIRRIYYTTPFFFFFFLLGKEKNTATFFCSESIAIDKNFSQNQSIARWLCSKARTSQTKGNNIVKLHWAPSECATHPTKVRFKSFTDQTIILLHDTKNRMYPNMALTTTK